MMSREQCRARSWRMDELRTHHSVHSSGAAIQSAKGSALAVLVTSNSIVMRMRVEATAIFLSCSLLIARSRSIEADQLAVFV